MVSNSIIVLVLVNNNNTDVQRGSEVRDLNWKFFYLAFFFHNLISFFKIKITVYVHLSCFNASSDWTKPDDHFLLDPKASWALMEAGTWSSSHMINDTLSLTLDWSQNNELNICVENPKSFSLFPGLIKIT